MQLPLVDSSFEECPRINARRRMTLKINQVPGEILRAGAQEMIEGDLVQRCSRGVSGDMAAQPAVFAVGVDDHRHGIPAHIALEAPLHFPVAGERGLLVGGNCVYIRSADHAGRFDALLAQPISQALKEPRRPLRSLVPQGELQH